MKTDLTCTAAFRDLKPLSEKPAPWTQVAIRGEYPGTVEIPAGYEVPGFGVAAEDMRVEGVTVFDDRTLESIVQRFDERILIDADHLSHDEKQTTEAMGWGLEVRYGANKNELELQTPWTPPGREKIANQIYRYISPEFSGAVRYEGGVFKFYPSALTGAGLTNRPKLKALRPVSANRETKDNKPHMKHALTLLCGLIGSPETATEQELTDKVTAFQSDLATSKNRAAQADRLETEIKVLREEAVTHDLERYSDVIEDKDSARELLQTNREATVKFFAAAQAKKATGGNPAPLYQKNRATAPDGKKFTEADPAENQKKAAQIRNRAAAIQASEGIPFNQAFGRAQAELG
jgi:hypothetical protein